jgi:hypothetical protein
MFDKIAKQVIHDAETLASNDGEYVHLHHITRALLQGPGISNTILKSFGITQSNVPLAPTSSVKLFFKPWKDSDESIYVDKYTPGVVAVWYHAQCLQNETGVTDAAEFFLIGLLEESGAYSEELRTTFNFTKKQVYRRIQHLQAVSLNSDFQPEAHARRLLSLAQSELENGSVDQTVKLVQLAVNEIHQAKNSPDHRLLAAKAQTVKQATRFYKTVAERCPSAEHLRRARRYAKLSAVLAAAVLQLADDNWQAARLGFTY